MKLQTEIIKPDKLICSEELLFNKGELNNKINTAIQTVAEDNLRSSIANVLSNANVKGRLEIQSHFEKSPFESAKTIASYSFLKDKLISLAFDVVQTTLQSSKNKQTNLDYISIIAVGGYPTVICAANPLLNSGKNSPTGWSKLLTYPSLIAFPKSPDT